jgi:hypothetical protein
MRFKCTSIIHPKPYEPSDYIRTNIIDVLCRTAGDEDAIATRLAVDYLDIASAECDGASVLHVCDADSAGWMHVYEATIEPAVDFAMIREDFGFDDPINGLLFLHSAVFHPDRFDWQRFVIDSVCSMFPDDTAMFMWKRTIHLIRSVDDGDPVASANKLRGDLASGVVLPDNFVFHDCPNERRCLINSSVV